MNTKWKRSTYQLDPNQTTKHQILKECLRQLMEANLSMCHDFPISVHNLNATNILTNIYTTSHVTFNNF